MKTVSVEDFLTKEVPSSTPYLLNMTSLRNSTEDLTSKNTPSLFPTEVPFLINGPIIVFFIGTASIAVVGTFLNLLAIVVLTQSSRRRRSDASTKFVLNLAIADLMFCSITIPSHWLQVRFRSHDLWGEVLCDVNQVSFFWTFQSSLYTLSCVSLNRMTKICHHDKYNTVFSKNRVRFIIFLCWFVSLFLAVLPVFGLYGEYQVFHQTKRSGRYYCGVSNVSKHVMSPSNFYYTTGFLVPFLCIVFSYVKIFLEVQKHRSSFLKSSISNAQSYKLFQTILMIFAGFIICYFPNLIIRGWIPYSPRYPYLRQLVKLLLYFNACLNPIIYFTMNQEYRNDFFSYINKVFKGQSIQSVFRSSPRKTSTQIQQKDAPSKKETTERKGSAVISLELPAEINEISVSPVVKDKISSEKVTHESDKPLPRHEIRRETQSTLQLERERKASQQHTTHDAVSGKHFFCVGVVFLSILVVMAFILDCNRHQALNEEEWMSRSKEMLESQFLNRFQKERQ